MVCGVVWCGVGGYRLYRVEQLRNRSAVTCVGATEQLTQPIGITKTQIDEIASGNKAAEGATVIAVILNQMDRFIFF
jgi:uncharacterized protein (UPF0179 family)